MKFFIVIFILGAALHTNGFSTTKDTDDKDTVIAILDCFQGALEIGVPEIGLPSFSPLKISKNFSVAIPLYEYSLEVTVENLTLKNFPEWKITQMDKVSTENADDVVFDYALNWESVTLAGNWRARLVVQDVGTQVFQDVGELIYEMDRLTASGRFNFSKNEDNKGFNEVTLRLHPEESPLHIDGLGLLSDIITYVGGRTLKSIVNLNLFADLLDAAVQNDLNANWVYKPDRVNYILSNCMEATIGKKN